MSRYTKTPSAKYFKHLRSAYPNGSKTSTRNPAVFSDSSLNAYEFKSVLPHILKDTVSGKGSNVKPKYECVETMDSMISCLKLSDYNETHCATEVQNFLECFKKFNVDSAEAMERAKAGIVDTDAAVRKYPRKFVLNMLDQYKNPSRIDNGPELPKW